MSAIKSIRQSKNGMLLMIIVGVMFMCIGIAMFSKSTAFSSEDTGVTKAKVIDISEYTQKIAGEIETKHDVTVRYTVEGETYDEALGYWDSTFKIGKQIDIMYQIDNPSNMKYGKGDAVIVSIMIIVGGIIGTIGLIGYIHIKIEENNRRRMVTQR